MWSGIGCVVFGCLLIHAWWLETYTDSPLAISWRRMSAAMSPTRNAQAMLRPCTGLMLVFGGVAVVLKEVGDDTAHYPVRVPWSVPLVMAWCTCCPCRCLVLLIRIIST